MQTNLKFPFQTSISLDAPKVKLGLRLNQIYSEGGRRGVIISSLLGREGGKGKDIKKLHLYPSYSTSSPLNLERNGG